MKIKHLFSFILLPLVLASGLRADVASARNALLQGDLAAAATLLSLLAPSAEVQILRSLLDIAEWIEGDLPTFATLIGADSTAAAAFTDLSANLNEKKSHGTQPIYGRSQPLATSESNDVTTYQFVDQESILVLYNSSNAVKTVEIDVTFAGLPNQIDWGPPGQGSTSISIDSDDWGGYVNVYQKSIGGEIVNWDDFSSSRSFTITIEPGEYVRLQGTGTGGTPFLGATATSLSFLTADVEVQNGEYWRYDWVPSPADALFDFELIEDSSGSPWGVDGLLAVDEADVALDYFVSHEDLLYYGYPSRSLSIQYNGTVARQVDLEFNSKASYYFTGTAFVNGVEVGDLQPYGFYMDGDDTWVSGDYNQSSSVYSYTFSLWMEPGDQLSIEIELGLWNTSVDATAPIFGFNLDSASDFQVSNGLAYTNVYPKFAPNTRSETFAHFLSRDGASTAQLLNTLIARIGTIQSGDRVVFEPVVTGLSESVVIEYADAQVLLAFLKFTRGVQLVVDMYGAGNIDLGYANYLNYMEAPAAIWDDYPQLMELVSSRRGQGIQAKQFLVEAIQHYRNVEATLWTRQSGLTESYLFEVGASTEQDRLNFANNLSVFETSLSRVVTLAEAFNDPLAPQDQGFSLKPLLSYPPVDLRAVMPQFDERGVLAGSSSSLLAAGFTQGIDITKFDQSLADFNLLYLPVLESYGNTDLLEDSSGYYAGSKDTPLVFDGSQFSSSTYIDYTALGVDLVNGAYRLVIYNGSQYFVADFALDGISISDWAPVSDILPEEVDLQQDFDGDGHVGMPSASKPTMLEHPASQSVTSGSSVTLSVSVGGEELSYQWYKDGSVIADATSATYTIGSASEADVGVYTVVVSNSAGSVTSNAATISVEDLIGPPVGSQLTDIESYGNTDLLEDSSGYYAGSADTPLVYNGSQFSSSTYPGFTALGVDLVNGAYRLVIYNGTYYYVADFALDGISSSDWAPVSDILPEEVDLQQDFDGDGHVGESSIDLTGKHFAIQMPDSTTANLYFLNNEAVLGITNSIWLDPYTANGFGLGSTMEIGYENPPTSVTIISASIARLTRYDDGVESVVDVAYTLSDFDPSGVMDSMLNRTIDEDFLSGQIPTASQLNLQNIFNFNFIHDGYIPGSSDYEIEIIDGALSFKKISHAQHVSDDSLWGASVGAIALNELDRDFQISTLVELEQSEGTFTQAGIDINPYGISEYWDCYGLDVMVTSTGGNYNIRIDQWIDEHHQSMHPTGKFYMDANTDVPATGPIRLAIHNDSSNSTLHVRYMGGDEDSSNSALWRTAFDFNYATGTWAVYNYIWGDLKDSQGAPLTFEYGSTGTFNSLAFSDLIDEDALYEAIFVDLYGWFFDDFDENLWKNAQTRFLDFSTSFDQTVSPPPPITDTDGDGLDDSVETNTGVYVSPSDTGTNPQNADTDGDGLSDGDELNIYNTNPTLSDTDGDGINDGDEVDDGTNPNYNPNTDSDGDGVSDRLELSDGTDPNNSNDYNPQSVGLIAYYPFNGNANDQSLYVVENQDANDGSVNGASLGIDRNNVANSSYDFDGIDDYIDIGDPDILDLGASNYTYSLWFRTDAMGINYYMLSKYEIRGANAFGIGTVGTDYIYSFFAGDNYSDGAALDGTSNINDGAWHHVVMAIDLDNFEYNLYLDGVLEGAKSFPFTSSGIDSNYPLLIGKIVDGQNFDGSIDDVRIYNRALSGSEVNALYESEAPDADGEIPQFQIIEGDFTWHEAKMDAESRGGRLAVLDTQEKIDTAITLATNPGSLTSEEQLWIGLSDSIVEGEFKWVDGTPLTVSNWTSGQPDNNVGVGEAGEDYVHMDSGYNWAWNDNTNVGSNGARNYGYLLEVIIDTDGDGLSDNVETNTGTFVSLADTGTDPQLADSSGDGLFDGAVVSAGFNPNVDYSSLITIIPNYTVDMNLRSLRLKREDNGDFNLNFDLEMSTDLKTWTPHASHSLELPVPDHSKTFMRLNIK